MNLDVKGKTALITGAAGGIGAATARLLVSEGVKVALFDNNANALDEVAAGLAEDRGEVMAYPGDVTESRDLEAAVAAVESRWGGLDILVSVAGGGTPRSLATLSADDWNRGVALNLSGPFHGIRAAHRAMARRGGGAIVTVGSLAGLTMSMNNGMDYTAAKAGVLGLTRHAAYELGRDGIRVNAVLPGPVLSPQMKAKITAEMLDEIPRELPLGRWVDPAEVAASILFFCSAMSAACTGTHVIIDSGQHVGAHSSREMYFARRDNL